MQGFPILSDDQIDAIAGILCNQRGALTGTEIANLLESCRIDDLDPRLSKRDRLALALKTRQRKDGNADAVFAFIQAVIAPVKYTTQRQLFNERRDGLNRVLSFAGLHVGRDGIVGRSVTALTLCDAERQAQRLSDELRRRSIHPAVLDACSAEVLKEDLFHAIQEAAKGVAQRIREMTGLTLDGGDLVDAALALGKTGRPRIAFNSLVTESEKSEQSGIANLLKGFFGAFRNPGAHLLRTSNELSELDALDILTLASYLHRRLDDAIVLSPADT